MILLLFIIYIFIFIYGFFKAVFPVSQNDFKFSLNVVLGYLKFEHETVDISNILLYYSKRSDKKNLKTAI
jgi:hypothetical protein